MGVNKGCPQGSILGPDLWNLVFDELLNKLKAMFGEKYAREGDSVIACADELMVVITDKSRTRLEEKARVTVETIESWCHENKLELTADKTEMITLKGQLKTRAPIIRVGNKRIEEGERVKYLEVTIGKRSNITGHVNEVSGRCGQAFYKLGMLNRANWGVGHKSMEILYKGVFLGIILYAVPAWKDYIRSNNQKELLKIQRMALIKVTKAYRTISYGAVQVIAGIWPLDLEIMIRDFKYRMRVGQSVSYEGMRWEIGQDMDEKLSYIRKKVIEEWDKGRKKDSKGRVTVEFFPGIKERLGANWIMLDHWVVQFLSGNGDFKEKLHCFKLKDSPLCECGEIDDIWHVLERCELFKEERDRMWQGMGRETGQIQRQ